MAWNFTPLASDINYLISAKLGTDTVANAGHLNDNDIGKPLKLTATDTYGLCADGDNIDGWLVAVNPETVDGYAFGVVQIGGRIWAQLDGASTFGFVVEASTTAAARTKEASGYGQVSSHATIGEATPSAAQYKAYIESKKWRIISGAVTDDAIVLLEKQ